MAQGGIPMTVFTTSAGVGGVGPDGDFSTTTANGVAVQAESSEGVFTIATSGAGGFYGGLAGAVTVNIGLFLNAVINFLLIAFSVFVIVKVANKMKKKEEAKPEPEPAPPSDEVLLLTEIRDLLKSKA